MAEPPLQSLNLFFELCACVRVGTWKGEFCLQPPNWDTCSRNSLPRSSRRLSSLSKACWLYLGNWKYSLDPNLVQQLVLLWFGSWMFPLRRCPHGGAIGRCPAVKGCEAIERDCTVPVPSASSPWLPGHLVSKFHCTVPPWCVGLPQNPEPQDRLTTNCSSKPVRKQQAFLTSWLL